MSQSEQVFIEGVGVEEADAAWQTTQTKSQKTKVNKANNRNSFKCSKKIMVSNEAAPNPINDLYNFQNIELVKSYISRSDKLLVILRGLPGSGKSTLAKYDQLNTIFF